MTHQIKTGQRLKELNSPDRIFNAVSAILDRALVQIIRFIKELGRGKCPWVHYQLPDGRRIATFLSPKAFQGYKWFNSFSKVVNLENGKVYQVSAPLAALYERSDDLAIALVSRGILK